MLTNKGLIRLSCAMMAAGLVGTLAVLGHVLPRPKFVPLNPKASAFDNAFVAKDQLLTAYQWVRLHVFHSVPPSVVVGKNGWLYYRSEAVGDEVSISDFMGRTVPDSSTLTRWQQIIKERRQALDGRGIQYLAFVAPNTMTIYPENLPNEIIQKVRGRTRLDAVMETMPDEIMDLRPSLLQRKRFEPVYPISNTHWNDAGAFAAYEAVTARLVTWFPAIRPVRRADLSTRIILTNGEVEFMIGQKMAEEPKPNIFLETSKVFDARCADTGEVVLAPGPSKFRNWVGIDSDCPSGRFIQDRQTLPKAVVFHDSFMMAMNPFLSQNFREVRYIRGRFNWSVVEQEKPDVVLDEVTERYLPQLFL